MAEPNLRETVQRAGDVKIERLSLISSNFTVVDLSEFLIEFSIFEDIFSNSMTGYVHLSDSRNLIDSLNLHGEELIVIKFKTPTFDDKTEIINKTFRTLKISDRQIVRDNNTQTFVIHFVSAEFYLDMMLPIFVSFEGTITNLVEKIFTDYIATNREAQISDTEKLVEFTQALSPLVILNETSNKVKFVSPGWSPFKCINWLASKSIPKPEDGLTSKNFLFWETNKSFYYGSIEKIYKDAYEDRNYIGRYTIAASNLKELDGSKDLNREYMLARDVKMIESVDVVKNNTNGYLSSRLVYLDLYEKNYELVDYDHVNEYFNQWHTSGPGVSAIPIWSSIGALDKEQLATLKANNDNLFKEVIRNPAANINFYPKHKNLHTGFNDNVNEVMSSIYGNRRSSLNEFGNIKIHMTVPGRTDIEVGRMLYFHFPGLNSGSNNEQVYSEKSMDRYYSGYYLITAIRHKVNKQEHTMTMEIVKDSLLVDTGSSK